MISKIMRNSDVSLVKRVPDDASSAGGGDAARGTRLEEYSGYLYCLVRQSFPAHLATKVECNDIVQEVLLKVLESDPEFSGRSAPERLSFLRKTCKSVLMDLIRRFDSGKRRAALDQSLDDSAARLEQWLAAVQSSPSERASKHEQLLLLARAVAELPENQRRAVELHHLMGRSLAETAATIGNTVDATAGLLRRGLASLRDRLDEGDGSKR